MTEYIAMAFGAGRRFFRWWFAELALLVPRWLSERLGRGDVLVVTYGTAHVRLTLESTGSARLLGDISKCTAESAARVQELLSAAPQLRRRLKQGRVPVVLQLPADEALRTRLTLPAAAEANLRQAMMFQLDRRTPFEPDAVYFAQRVLARDDAAKTIEAELTVVPRSIVASAISAVRTLGLTASTVQIAAAGPGEAPSGNVLPDDLPSPRAATWALRGVLATLAMVGVVALYQPFHAAHRKVDQLQSQVQAAKALALRSRKLKDEVDKLVEIKRFLVRAKRDVPSATEVLFELTRSLPSDTWLEDLHVHAGEIRISGFSSSASSLIGVLQRSTVFSDPQFRAAVTQNQAVGKERFELTAKIAKRGPGA